MSMRRTTRYQAVRARSLGLGGESARALLATGLAIAAWLALTRTPAEGAAVFAATIGYGVVIGIVTRAWWSGLVALVGATGGDLLAVAMGWFLYLSDNWLVLPLVASGAALAGPALRALLARLSPTPRTDARA